MNEEFKDDLVNNINKKFDQPESKNLKNKSSLNHIDPANTQKILDQLMEYFTKTNNFNKCASQICTICQIQNYTSKDFQNWT